MIDPATYKTTCLDGLHQRLLPSAVELYRNDGKTPKEKAAAINGLIKQERQALLDQLPAENNSILRIVLEYCIAVVSLEYRNMLWPYDYMSLSRRVGELWERTCRAAWDFPASDRLGPMTPPDFNAIRADIREKFQALAMPGMEAQMDKMVSQVMGLIGQVNMKSDGVHLHDGMPLVVDFKSGFGSNEKGNTERLQRVGRAYRLWKPETRLLLLVRQSDHNNNYLKTLEDGDDWEVLHSGDAYRAMHAITGTDIDSTLRQIATFRNDLTPRFWERLRATKQDLERYLDWSASALASTPAAATE
jgi:hypothetical protein